MEEDTQEALIGQKRVKINEENEILHPIYDTKELHYHCEEKDRISLCYKHNERVRLVSKALSKTRKLELFKKLNEELEFIAKIYSIKITDLHLLFLEVSCDLERLKKVLTNDPEANKQKWDELSDLAIQNQKESIEYKAICQERGINEVLKRRKFLERYESG